jgi:hypothetical protein
MSRTKSSTFPRQHHIDTRGSSQLAFLCPSTGSYLFHIFSLAVYAIRSSDDGQTSDWLFNYPGPDTILVRVTASRTPASWATLPSPRLYRVAFLAETNQTRHLIAPTASMNISEPSFSAPTQTLQCNGLVSEIEFSDQDDSDN